MDFDITFIHIDLYHKPGVDNIWADLFSRNVNATQSLESEEALLLKLGKKTPPPNERLDILEKIHLIGHFGEHSYFSHLWDQDYWWPSIRADIKLLLKNFDVCQSFT